MYSCPLHQWNSYESPCPSCHRTVTVSTTEITTGPVQLVVPESPTTADASVLVEALKPFADMFGELTEQKVQQGGVVFKYNYCKITVSDLLNASKALFKYNQSTLPNKIEESGLKEGEDKFWDDFAIEYEALQRMEENTWEWNRSILKEKYRISKI